MAFPPSVKMVYVNQVELAYVDKKLETEKETETYSE